MNFLIMVVLLAYSLGPIFDFAKYSKQACLRLSPCLELQKQPLEVGERRHTKGPGEDTNTFEQMRVSFEELVFIFENLLKTSRRNLKQGMDKWCFMNRS